MSESEYIRKEAEGHPEAGYLADLRILRRFVRNGSFGYLASDEVVFRTLKAGIRRRTRLLARSGSGRP